MRYRKVSAEQVGKYGEPVLRIYARGEDRKRYQFNIPNLPSYFFVSREPKYEGELKKKVKKIDSGYVSLFGDPLWKVYTFSPGDTNILRQGQHHFEADIHWTERACIDLKITDGFSIDPFGKPVPIESAEDIPLRTWVIDVEIITDPTIFADWTKPNYQTACIVVYDSYDNRQYTFSTKDIPEETMFKEFLSFIEEKNPDVITGWNIKFDVTWLIARMQRLGLEYQRLSPLGNRVDVRKHTLERGLEIIICNVPGRVIFDGLEAYKSKKNPSGKLSSYNLHSVAEAEKLQPWDDLGDRIQASWNNNPDDVINYCRTDVEREWEIISKEKLIEQALALCKLSGCTPPQTTKKEPIIDHALLLRRGARILPSKRRGHSQEEKNKENTVKGGMVLLPSSGIHRGLGVFDAAALYPSIIEGFNISAETKSKHGTIVIRDGDKEYKFLDPKIKKGILPETIKEFRDLREKVRKKKYEAEEKFGHDSPEYKALEEEDTADKFIITAFYGVNAFEGFRLFDPDCANAITAVGRQIVNGLATHLANSGYPVEYGDTDSVFVKLGELDNGFKAKDIIQNYINETLRGMGVEGEPILVKFEKFFRWCIFKQRRIKKGYYETVKKKYAAHMTWSEGENCDFLYIRGFETRRSDTPPILKTTMQDFFERIKEDKIDEAINLIRRIKEKWKSYDPLDIALPRAVHKMQIVRKADPERGLPEKEISNPWIEGIKHGKSLGWQYDNDTAPALLYLKDSDFPVICIQKQHTLPKDFKVDYDLMFDKIVRKKFEPILDAIGENWERQFEPRGESLDKWFS